MLTKSDLDKFFNGYVPAAAYTILYEPDSNMDTKVTALRYIRKLLNEFKSRIHHVEGKDLPDVWQTDGGDITYHSGIYQIGERFTADLEVAKIYAFNNYVERKGIMKK